MNSSEVSPIALCAIFIAAVFSATTPASAQVESMLGPFERFEDARQRGDFLAAAEYGRQSADATIAEFGADSLEAASAFIRLATVLRAAGEFEAAARNALHALEISERAIGVNHPDIVPLLELLSDIERDQGNLDGAAAYLERALSVEQAVYGEQNDVVLTTLSALRDLYAEAGDEPRLEETETRIAKAGESTRDLGILDDGRRRYAPSEGYATVRVFYGTDRAPTGDSKPGQHYGRERGELEVGYVDVSIPETHKYGELETESRFSLYSYILGDEAKKRRYVLLQKVEPLGQDAFYGQLDAYIEGSPTRDVFLFVHGYNVSFEDASRRAAQLAYDLDFEGTPMLYSWPSRASTAAYTVDEASVRPSGRKLARLLAGVVNETGAGRIHLVAHSMGNRALIEALQAYMLQYGREASRETFDQIVFTAPDVDHDYFLETVEAISDIAKRVTLYASSNDLALKSSRILHGAARAGLAGDTIVSHPAIDTIDVSGIDADILGHSYFAVNEGAIYDLFRLFWRGEPPPQRCSMREQQTSYARFWQFDLDNCRGSELLEAGLIYRRFGTGALQRIEQHIAEIKDDEDKVEWTAILDRVRALMEHQK